MHSPNSTGSESCGEPIRVVLVGNERVTRAGLRMLIDNQPGFRVIAEAECTGNLETVWSAPHPQIAVIDLDNNTSTGFIPDAREEGPSNTRIVVLTSTPESNACANAIARGVLGVVSKQQAPEILLKAIERVHAGEVWLNRATIAGVIGTLRKGKSKNAAGNEALTPRERQIIELVGQGRRNNEIAEAIFVSEATVRNCLASIFRKLGISNRVHLMIYAIQEGFVKLPVSASSHATHSSRGVLRLAASTGRPLEQAGQPLKGHIK